MRVLFLIAHPTIEGPLPKIAPLVARGLRDEGIAVDVSGWSRRWEGESKLDKLAGRSADLRRVLRLLDARRYDAMVVTTTHDRPALLRDVPLVAAARDRVPVIVLEFHGSMVAALRRPEDRLFSRVSRWLVERADQVWVLSSEEVEGWRAVCPRGRFELVANPFVPPPEAAAPPAPRDPEALPSLLFVGRLISAKGVFDAVDATGRLCRTTPCRLTVAGSGDAGAVAEAAGRAGCADAVEIAGYLEHADLMAAYRRADVFVLPTYFGEGFPTVLAEAMAFGLPIVTTAIRGAADLLEDGVNALFVPPRDPPALAAALERLLAEPELRKSMGEANRAKVADFAPHKVVPHYAALLRDLVATGGRRSVGLVARPDGEHRPATSSGMSGDAAASDGGSPAGVRVLDVTVTPLGPQAAARDVARWTTQERAYMVCAVNVHMVMEAHDDPGFAEIVSRADMAVADGRPVWWACRLLGDRAAVHLRGEDLLLALGAMAAREGVPVGLYGSTAGTLATAAAELERRFPGLRVVCRVAPPFRDLDPDETAEVRDRIVASGARILFVALGCPKQERWMASQRESLHCVMVGVGAAVDMLVGTVKPAPRPLQRLGLEWAYRLVREPRRLWRRYARHNGRFVALLCRQLLSRGRRGG